jgi:hypothetical protein
MFNKSLGNIFFKETTQNEDNELQKETMFKKNA